MNDSRRFSLVKPTTKTPFRIDFDWWKEHDGNWRVFLLGYLCPDHQAVFTNQEGDHQIDWVDPETAEVLSVDGLQHTLMSHCAKQPGFITSNSTMVDSVFRIFLASGNDPMTPEQLGEKLNKSAETILKTFSGQTVYKGIRPKHE